MSLSTTQCYTAAAAIIVMNKGFSSLNYHILNKNVSEASNLNILDSSRDPPSKSEQYLKCLNGAP